MLRRSQVLNFFFNLFTLLYLKDKYLLQRLVFLASFCWSYNTQLYFDYYHPGTNTGISMMICSIVGGTIGIASGGIISDLLVSKYGMLTSLTRYSKKIKSLTSSINASWRFFATQNGTLAKYITQHFYKHIVIGSLRCFYSFK